MSEGRQQFSITYRGVDGTKTTKFSNLSDAARYVKDQDMGVDYRRQWGLQGEYGQFGFNGFSWTDIMDNPFSENGEWKHDLFSAPIRVVFRQTKVGFSSDKVMWKATAGGRDEGSIYERDGKFEAVLGGSHTKKSQSFPRLDLAKQWLSAEIQKDIHERHPLPAKHDPMGQDMSEFDDDQMPQG